MTRYNDNALAAAHWEPTDSAAQHAASSSIALVTRLRLECRVTGSAAVLLTQDVLRQFSSILTALLQVCWPLAVSYACCHHTAGDAGGCFACPFVA